MAVEKWSADAVGTMNEAFIPELIETLETEGKADWARTLRGHWEGKVDRFVNRTPNLYGSEFAFDSTGFESTGAFANYAMTHAAPGCDAADAQAASAIASLRRALKFMNFQLLLNMSDRGWLETTYYQLGSDYRGNLSYLLSYMSQMGGWSILDYGLHFAKDPDRLPPPRLRIVAQFVGAGELRHRGERLRLLVPGKDNDGATGGGFMPEADRAAAWIGKQMPRGAWYYSAEEDVGYAGALRTHATIVARDPVFGDIAYGGVLTREGTQCQGRPARRPARPIPRRPRRSAPAPGARSRRLREGAAGRRRRRSVAGPVRRSRIAAAGRTRRDCRSLVCPPATTS